MTRNVSHFDGWGNPILDFYSMRNRFPIGSKEREVIRVSLPYQYAIIPDAVIRFYRNDPCQVEIILIYPGGERRFTRCLPERAVKALRTAYKGRGGWIGRVLPDGRINLVRGGSVVRLRSWRVGIEKSLSGA